MLRMTGNRSVMQMVDTLVEHRRICAPSIPRLLRNIATKTVFI